MELAEFQPSLRDYLSSINLPRITSWAKFSRPFGTFTDFFRSLFSRALIQNTRVSAVPSGVLIFH
jgi:hypothetical protein